MNNKNSTIQKAIELLRKIDWCYGCINYKGIGECGIDKMEECTEENDLYYFKGFYEEEK